MEAYSAYRKMWSFIILALFCLVGSSSQKCPEKYQRFSPNHTFCLEPSKQSVCSPGHSGLTGQEKNVILTLHNQFRSKIAMGLEDNARGVPMPEAADMMQMEWDNELAALAQKWADHCVFEHDCLECKAVEKFAVGQILSYTHYSPCVDTAHTTCEVPHDRSEWDDIINGFYEQLKDYHVYWLDKYKRHPEANTDKLTQMIWSRSWRVGCGYSFFRKDNSYHQYQVCNYGPRGNIEGEPVYKQGQPCTACPTNTQCSTTRRGPNTYPGLCKMTDPDDPPAYPRKERGVLLYCDPSSSDVDCQARNSGFGKWKRIHSIGGKYYTIELQGPQVAYITFNTLIEPKGDTFCLGLNFRKGPLDASRADKSILFLMANFKVESILDTNTTIFTERSINVRLGSKTTLGLTFLVPGDAGEHVLDVRKIVAYDGRC